MPVARTFLLIFGSSEALDGSQTTYGASARPPSRTTPNPALQQARDRHANSTIKLGDTALSGEFEVPQGGAAHSTFALITIAQAMPR